MLAKHKMGALCAHIEPLIARAAHDVMTIQHAYDDNVIELEDARSRLTQIEQNFLGCGEETANEVFLETLRRQIQELE